MPSYIQSATNSTSNSLTVSKAYGSNNTLGNFLLAAVHIFNNGGGPGLVTVTDTAGNVWSQIPGNYNYGTNGFDSFWYVPVCKAGANTVTCSCSNNGGSNYPSITILEYSGVNAFEIQNSGTGTGTATNSGNITTTGVQDLLVVLSTNVTSATTETPAAGWTLRQSAGGDVYDQIVGPGTYNFTSTLGASVTWGTYIIALKQATTILVQSTNALIVNTSSGGSLAFGSNNGLGNCLMAFVHYNNWGGSTDPTAAITDSQGNVWTQVGTYLSYDPDKKVTAVFVAANAKAGANTVTLSIANSVFVNTVTLFISEYSGVSTTSPIDASGSQFLNSTSDPSVTLTLSKPGELAIIYWSETAGNPTYPGSFVLRQTFPTPLRTLSDGLVVGSGSQSFQVTTGGANAEKFLWVIALTPLTPPLPGTVYAFIA